nr:MAG TPA: hypothetical protein [Caudoviricetes sp.]DAS06852.1 MAG TPA: hypothetical protein [Caudoviricetes sp.]
MGFLKHKFWVGGRQKLKERRKCIGVTEFI